MRINSNKRYQKERQFGLLITGLILALCLYHLINTGSVNIYPLAIAVIMLTISGIRPMVLYYPRIGWEKIGYYLGLINTVLLLTMIYFLIFLPIGLLFRLTGRDLLGIRSNKGKTSYWETAEKTDTSFKYQF